MYEGERKKVAQCLSLFSVSPSAAYHVTGAVNGTLTTFVVDTGAVVILLRADPWERIQSPDALLEPWTDTSLVGANGTPIHVLGSATVTLTVAETVFLVWVVVVKQLTAEANLAVDFLAKNGCTVKVGKKILDFPNHGVSSPLIHSNSKYMLPPNGAFLVEIVGIAAFREMEVMATTQTSVTERNWILKGEQRDKVPVVAARAIIRPVNRMLPVQLLNHAMESVAVYKGTRIACLEALDGSNVIDSASIAVVHQSESISHVDPLFNCYWMTVTAFVTARN